MNRHKIIVRAALCAAAGLWIGGVFAATGAAVADNWRFCEPDYAVLVPDSSLLGNDNHHKVVNEHFHVLVSPKSGDLLAFWTQESFEGSDDMHICFARSRDGGKTWTLPRIFRGSPKPGSGIANAVWQLPMFTKSGRLYCFWNEREKPGRGMGVGYMKGAYSDDDGETWSEPTVVWQPRQWCSWQRPLRLAKGGRYLTAVSIADEATAKTCFMRFENLDDNPEIGAVKISLFMDGAKRLDGEEASIVKLPDGRLFAVMRSKFGVPLWTASADGGETWSDAKAVVDADGRKIAHPRSPCPIYDLGGESAGSGRYFALFCDAFDAKINQWEGRGPLYRYDGAFDAKGDQPVRFTKRGILLKRPGSSHYGNSCYSSFTKRGDERVLWFPDNKFYLLGKVIQTGCAPASDADKNNSTAMNAAVYSADAKSAGGFKVLFIGNSITLHGSLPSIGWTNVWGMAASAKEKDYVHLVTRELERRFGRKADLTVRNLADFERNFRSWDFSKAAELAKIEPDVLVIALGENVSALPTEKDRLAYRDAFKKLLGALLDGRRTKPRAVVRGVFWPNADKDWAMANVASDYAIPFVKADFGNQPGMDARDSDFKHSGVRAHPGDRGMEKIAEVILKGLMSSEQRTMTRGERFHFVIPGNGDPGDSNGAFWHNGRYHLMYLYKRTDGYAWGHVSSTDLFNWKTHPDAIAKYEKSPGGCFSGGAFMDDDGKAYLSYWMLWGARGLGLAVGDGDFDTFTNLKENPVIRSTHWGWTLDRDAKGGEVKYASADPSNIWKKDGRYFMLAGNLCLLNDNGRKPDSPEAMKGDCAYLFESSDLKTWRYRHPFYQRRIAESRATGWTDPDEDCMCPSFLPLADAAGKPSGKYLLLFISHNRGCQYYIGTYDRKNDKFIPERHGRMTWQDKSYFAPEVLVDGRNRQLIWTWLLDNRKDEFKRFGQTGVYGLPRSVWLADDGTLGMAPAEEVKALRQSERNFGEIDLAKGKSLTLDGFAGDCCEIELQFDGQSVKNFALELKSSFDGKEKTIIRLDAERGELVFDATASNRESINDFCNHVAVERAPFRLKSGEALKLRVFVDGPVVEVCANDRQMITRRVYVDDPKSTTIRLTAASGDLAQVKAKAWEMAAAPKGS